MNKTKAGVIGMGFIGPAHVEALRRLGYVDVAAITHDSLEGARAKAEAMCVPKAYGSPEELLKDAEIETVHICTPNHLHYPLAKAAILAGKHVVCEKPLAMDSAQAKELVSLAKENGVACAVHFNIRFYPLMHHARAMVQNGDLGEIFAVNGSYQQDWLQKQTDYNWRLEPEYSGDSRAVADIGSHWLDSVEFVTGLSVKRVLADFATFYPVRKKPLVPLETYSGKLLKSEDYADVNIGTEDYATVLLRFGGGAHGSLTVNQVAAGRKNRMCFEIYGSKAAVAINTERPNELWIGRRDGNNEIVMKDPSLVYPASRDIIGLPGGHNEGFYDTSKQMFGKFYSFVRSGAHKKGGAPDFPAFEAGLRELLLCEAIVRSAREEKWQEI